MVDRINEIASEYNKVTVMCASENKAKYIGKDILDYGSKNNLEEISSNIFSMLRNADKNESDIILIEGIESSGIGLAIMNRLIRACSHEFYIV
jgi:L-threonylcarbamoyladenylate synthase